ncbi:MAG: hypothetical protein FWG74_08965 [Planctomycetes bacterium]|nr:hypothetical protein [Planctomycetota bacterium]
MPDTNNPAEPANNGPPRKTRQPRKPRNPRASEAQNPIPAPPASIADALAEAATGPKQVAVDGQTVQAHDLRQLIEADRYLASKKAARRPALQFDKLAPPGAD